MFFLSMNLYNLHFLDSMVVHVTFSQYLNEDKLFIDIYTL